MCRTFGTTHVFLNVRFGQKVFKFTVFGCHDLRFACIISYFLLSTQVFHSICLNFFGGLFYFKKIFFAQPSISSSFTPLKNFFTPLKFFCPPLNIFLHPGNFYTPPKSFFYHLNFSQPPAIFIALTL